MSHAQLFDLVKQLALIVGLGGVAVPYVTALINNLHWSSKAKQAVMIGVSVVVGAVTYLAQNNWQVTDSYSLAVTIFGVITAAQAAYHGLWKPGQITTAITAARTNVTARLRGKTPAPQTDQKAAA